jgi:hypothetical protein
VKKALFAAQEYFFDNSKARFTANGSYRPMAKLPAKEFASLYCVPFTGTQGGQNSLRHWPASAPERGRNINDLSFPGSEAQKSFHLQPLRFAKDCYRKNLNSRSKLTFFDFRGDL